MTSLVTTRYDRGMSTVRITDTELARDVHAVLEKVRQGVEVIIEHNNRAVAVIKTPSAPVRGIRDSIARARAYEDQLGYKPVPDPDFAKDVEEGIAARSHPLDPPSWD